MSRSGAVPGQVLTSVAARPLWWCGRGVVSCREMGFDLRGGCCGVVLGRVLTNMVVCFVVLWYPA